MKKKSHTIDTPYSIACSYLNKYLSNDFEAMDALLSEEAVYDMPGMKDFYCKPDRALPLKGKKNILYALQDIWNGMIPQKFNIVHSYISEDRMYFSLLLYFHKKGKHLVGASVEDSDMDFHFVMPANVVLEMQYGKVCTHLDYLDWSVIYPQIQEQMAGKKVA